MKVASVTNYNPPVCTPKHNVRQDFSPVFKSAGYKQIDGVTKIFNRVFKKGLCACNFAALEGVQKGLKTFEGLSIKQMAFAFTDLHSINMMSGCTNHCLHCYANAQPFIKRYPFEDLVQICSDAKEFKNRTGINLAHHHGDPYIEMSFDADAIDCHLYDRNGVKHDFIEIAKIMREGLGYKPVFDTNGWDLNNKDKQKRAEEYVEKLMQDKNYKNFYQINISINPFSPKYTKILNSGYSPDELYTPLREIGVEDNRPEDLKKASDMYLKYLKKTANILYTFKPLLKAKNFSVIIRALNNDIPEMKGYRIEDFATTLQHLYAQLYLTYVLTGRMSEKELKKYADLLGRVSGRMFSSGRMEKFYRVKNKDSEVDGIMNIDEARLTSYLDLERVKYSGSLSKASQRYLKMITPDGKVYLYDNYAIIPTDVRIKTSTPDISKPFSIPVENFTVTDKMIDLI